MLTIFHSSFIINQEVTYGNWISLIPSHQTGWVYIILQVHTWLFSLHTFGHRAMLKLSAPETWCILQSTLSSSPLAAVLQGKCWPVCTHQAETVLFVGSFVCLGFFNWLKIEVLRCKTRLTPVLTSAIRVIPKNVNQYCTGILYRWILGCHYQ